MPKISVIIPLYNAEKYVAQALGSVLGQTMGDYEVLIVDDGSSDNSVAVCRELKDPRIKIISQTNSGAASARNRGINESIGDYIAFLDADDAWVPEKLAKQLAHLEHSPDVGISFGRSLLMDQSGVRLTILQKMPTHCTAVELLLRNLITNTSTPFIRRQVLEDIRFKEIVNGTLQYAYFDCSLRGGCEDYELWVRIALTTDWKIEGLPDYLTLYRIHPDSASSRTETMLKNHSKALEKIRSYSPGFIVQWGKAARAYLLLHMARKSLRFRNPTVAMKYTKEAMLLHRHPLWFHPVVTLQTISAACLLQVLPKGLYDKLEKMAFHLIDHANKIKHGSGN